MSVMTISDQSGPDQGSRHGTRSASAPGRVSAQAARRQPRGGGVRGAALHMAG